MAIQIPPITEDESLNFILFELVNLVNQLEQDNLKLKQDIIDATNFADLNVKVNT